MGIMRARKKKICLTVKALTLVGGRARDWRRLVAQCHFDPRFVGG